MANLKPAIVEIPEDEEDLEFLCQLEAAEAQALSLSSDSKRRRITVDSHVKLEREKEDFVEEIEEGAYTAALKGSKSLTWKKHQQSSLTSKAFDSSTTVGGGGGSSVGGACFRCGKDGHWARDCPQMTPSAGNVGLFAPSSTTVVGAEKMCPCGLGNCLLLTANTERNRGRKFFRCPLRQESGGCGFFEWCDESSGNSPYAEGRAWKNGGQQQFYQRPVNQAASGLTKSCNEFDKGTSASNFSYRAAEKFETTDNKSYGMKNGSSCFKCGQEGHWAKDCSMTSPNNVTAAVGMKSSSGSCYKCGQSGHWARDCTQAQSTKVRNW